MTQRGMGEVPPGPIPKHLQVELAITVMVDAGMVELLRNLWRLGYVTCASCQGDDQELAYVMFSDSLQVDCFLADSKVAPWRGRIIPQDTVAVRFSSDQIPAINARLAQLDRRTESHAGHPSTTVRS